MSKSEGYAAKSDMDEFDAIGDKLAQDLRRSVRTLDHYPILSDPWIEMADVFGRIANISDVESKLSSSKKDATLWETEEQALRFLLEDGKLNLCVRILIEFKAAQIDSRRENKGPMIDYARVCDKFEKGLGTILRNAWQHVEVMQTTDVPAVVNHISDVIDYCLELPRVLEGLLAESDVFQRQELLVLQYLHDMVRNVEHLGENRLMPLLRERSLFMKLVRFLNRFGEQLVVKQRFLAAETLALLVQTEDFVTLRDRYVSERREVEELATLKEQLLAPLMTDLETKKVLRPLADSIEKAKRQIRK